MKKIKEIIGLPIISIFDGTEIGMVKNIIINAEDRSVSYLVVENGLHLLGAKVIATDRVLGIGEHAVTVEDDNVVSMISKIPAAMDLLEKNVQIKGSKVLTKKGRLVGEITEIYVDEDDRCLIKGMEFLPLRGDGNVRFLPDKSIITYGRHLIIVTEIFETSVLDIAEAYQQAAPSTDASRPFDDAKFTVGSGGPLVASVTPVDVTPAEYPVASETAGLAAEVIEAPYQGVSGSFSRPDAYTSIPQEMTEKKTLNDDVKFTPAMLGVDNSVLSAYGAALKAKFSDSVPESAAEESAASADAVAVNTLPAAAADEAIPVIPDGAPARAVTDVPDIEIIETSEAAAGTTSQTAGEIPAVISGAQISAQITENTAGGIAAGITGAYEAVGNIKGATGVPGEPEITRGMSASASDAATAGEAQTAEAGENLAALIGEPAITPDITAASAVAGEPQTAGTQAVTAVEPTITPDIAAASAVAGEPQAAGTQTVTAGESAITPDIVAASAVTGETQAVGTQAVTAVEPAITPDIAAASVVAEETQAAGTQTVIAGEPAITTDIAAVSAFAGELQAAGTQAVTVVEPAITPDIAAASAVTGEPQTAGTLAATTGEPTITPDIAAASVVAGEAQVAGTQAVTAGEPAITPDIAAASAVAGAAEEAPAVNVVIPEMPDTATARSGLYDLSATPIDTETPAASATETTAAVIPATETTAAVIPATETTAAAVPETAPQPDIALSGAETPYEVSDVQEIISTSAETAGPDHFTVSGATAFNAFDLEDASAVGTIGSAADTAFVSDEVPEAGAAAVADAGLGVAQPALETSGEPPATFAAPQTGGAVSDINVVAGETLAPRQVESAEPAILSAENAAIEISAADFEPAAGEALPRDSIIASETTLFEQRQRRYLTGRIVTKTILDGKGNVIVEAGVAITEDIIDRVRKNGRMVQLVMNNRS